ncbi:MAG: hypothetical protein IH960_12065 [Chloroflexi bacterium]|nr:hypothetical protein [Chloroflexota bacterium]
MSLKTILTSAVVTGLVVGAGGGFAQDRWFGDEDSSAPVTAGQFTAPDGFPGGANINPGDFIDLAEAEGGGAALESFIGSQFGAGGPDPDFLRERLSGFGMQVPEGATTAEMLEMLATAAESIFPAPGE